MSKKALAIALLTVLCLGAWAASADAAMVRVAKRYNVVSGYGGYSSPVGKYDGIFQLEFEDSFGDSYDLDAADVYDPSYHLGLTYGQLRNDRMLIDVGFRYTAVDQLDSFYVGDLVYFFQPTPDIHQFDLEVNFNYFAVKPATSIVAPYGGLGLKAGFTTFSAEGVESESEVGISTAVNFGLEVKLMEMDKGRSFVTLASINSYDFWGSADRPKYLNVGAAVKYYYR